MHDPLPPTDSEKSVYTDYMRLQEQVHAGIVEGNRHSSNPAILFLESLLPGFRLDRVASGEAVNQPQSATNFNRLVEFLRNQGLLGGDVDPNDFIDDED